MGLFIGCLEFFFFLSLCITQNFKVATIRKIHKTTIPPPLKIKIVRQEKLELNQIILTPYWNMFLKVYSLFSLYLTSTEVTFLVTIIFGSFWEMGDLETFVKYVFPRFDYLRHLIFLNV